MLAILAPGQGAQRQGFLSDWLALPGFAERLEELGAAADVDLLAAGTTMSDSDISDTAIAQPLIVGAGLAALSELGIDAGVVAYAGHSVGEFTVAAASGVLTPDAAMRLIAVRGSAMAEASAATPSGMAAVLGGDEAEVLAAIAAAGCVAANFNCAGQIVAAGPAEGIERLVAAPPAGARVRPLAVAGAFHTDYMRSARAALSTAAAECRVADSELPVISNRDGAPLTNGTEVLARLVEQVCRPVRWDACMDTLIALGVTAVVELPPAGTLAAIVRRAMPGVDVVALRTPADLAAARELALVGAA